MASLGIDIILDHLKDIGLSFDDAYPNAPTCTDPDKLEEFMLS